MSVPIIIEEVCFVCENESRQTVLASTNQFGAPDLDLRPPEMARSTMCWWVHECPHCGYVSEDLSDETTVTKEWLESEEYLSLDNIKFEDELAIIFYKRYLINNKERHYKSAFNALLRSAWACDDANDVENAVYCRKKAIETLKKFKASGKQKDTFVLIKADLLRRSGQFDLLIEELKDKTFSDEFLNKVAGFQIEKARQKDTACYTLADVQ